MRVALVGHPRTNRRPQSRPCRGIARGAAKTAEAHERSRDTPHAVASLEWRSQIHWSAVGRERPGRPTRLAPQQPCGAIRDVQDRERQPATRSPRERRWNAFGTYNPRAWYAPVPSVRGRSWRRMSRTSMLALCAPVHVRTTRPYRTSIPHVVCETTSPRAQHWRIGNHERGRTQHIDHNHKSAHAVAIAKVLRVRSMIRTHG